VDRGADAYEKRSLEIRMRNLKRNAAQLGFELVAQNPAPTPA